MDLKERLAFFLVGLFLLQLFCVANAKLVFPVERKFKGSVENLAAMKDHDAQRRGRFLSAVDIPLGGNGRANSNGSVCFPSSLFSSHFCFSHVNLVFFCARSCVVCVLHALKVVSIFYLRV